MIVQNKGGKGNPNHSDVNGRFISATDNSIPYLNDEGTKSSAYSKKQLMDGKTWEELAQVEMPDGRIENKQDDYIDVYFTSPIIKELFYKPLKIFHLVNVFDPADYDQEYDKMGIDTIAENEKGTQFTIDWKCATGSFGQPINVKNPVFNIVLCKYDPRTDKDVYGYPYKINSKTFSFGFVAMDCPYTKQEIGKNQISGNSDNINGASMFLTTRRNLRNYLYDSNLDPYSIKTKFEEMRDACKLFMTNSWTDEITDKYGNTLTLRVVYKSKTKGYECSLRVSGNILKKYCNAYTLYAIKRN